MDLLILCCFGGVPFIEFPISSSSSQHQQQQQQQQNIRHQWDPTDWIATDMSGSLLNASANSALLAANPTLKQLIPLDLPPELSLEQCDLWNLTFASGADEHVFRRSWGRLKCRCPRDFVGTACHQRETTLSPITTTKTTSSNNNNNTSQHISAQSSNIITNRMFFSSTPMPMTTTSPTAALAASAAVGLSRHENSFSMFLLVFMLLAGAMVALFLMLRGCCFCDCFGGCSRSHRRRYDQPMDRQTVNVCMEAIRVHEQNEKNKWAAHGHWSSSAPPPSSCMVVDSRRPLLPQSPAASSHLPSVSESVPMAPPPPRACSPPPSYRSLNASLEQLPGGVPPNTKI